MLRGLFILTAAPLVAALDLDACPMDRCAAGTPTACPLAPSPGGSLPAEEGTYEKVFFRNDGARPALLLRVDGKGEEHLHVVLAPGARSTVETHQGAVWRARRVDTTSTNGGAATAAPGRLLVEHRVAPVSIDGCACPPISAPDCGRPPFRGYRTTWDPVVFENDSPLPVTMSWFDGDCEESLRIGTSHVLPPFSSVRFIATYGHTFRAHAADNPGVLLRQHTIGDVVIGDCHDERLEVPAGEGAALEEAGAVSEADAATLASMEDEAAALRASNDALRARLEAALDALRTASAPNATAAAAGVVASKELSAALGSLLASPVLATPTKAF